MSTAGPAALSQKIRRRRISKFRSSFALDDDGPHFAESQVCARAIAVQLLPEPLRLCQYLERRGRMRMGQTVRGVIR